MLGNENKVCKLIKSLYGMKQAPKQWHQKFDEVVLSNVYSLNQANKCVYRKFDESGKCVIICLCVDDMLIFGTSQIQVDMTKEFLSSRFSMKDMGEADAIFDIRIKHESNGIAISQSHYIEKVLKKFNFFNYTLVSTFMDTNEKLMPNNGQTVSQLEYSKVIGCLMYAMTCIRPDITFVVGKLSRYTSNPGIQHWQAIQRVLKYLKKTMDYSLTYTGYLSVLEGYTDASWINNTEDNSSTSGWVFLLGGATGKEAEWLRNLILEIPLWSKSIAPISIRCDSVATLVKAYSQMYNVKSRHLGVRHSMICELIMNKVEESSDEECSTSGSKDEEYVMAVRDFKKCGDPNHLIGECPKPPKDKNQRAFVKGSWSDSGEEDDEKVKDETCLVAQASNEMLRTPSMISLPSPMEFTEETATP
ncbi:zinc finger, CCHC-type containing protein [Tanacetum coccineum]